MTKISKQKNTSTAIMSSSSKGKVIEKLVAELHRIPEVSVQQNVKIKGREIDILVTTIHPIGYPVQWAIECKNEGRRTEPGEIDAFYGKLQQIGIPPQHGIFVSRMGYSSGAIERAKKDGIRLLTLTGLEDRAIEHKLATAVNSIYYSLLVIELIAINNNSQSLLFYNDKQNICGTIPDLVWHKWLNNEISSYNGVYWVDFALPKGWYQIVDGKLTNEIDIKIRVRVINLVINGEGKAIQFNLVNATDKQIEKTRTKIIFDNDEAVLPMITTYTEEELEEIQNKFEPLIRNIERIRLPRILYYEQFYWPPSERTGNLLFQKMVAYQAQQISDPRPFKLSEVEGMLLPVIWAPIWNEFFKVNVQANDVETQVSEYIDVIKFLFSQTK